MAGGNGNPKEYGGVVDGERDRKDWNWSALGGVMWKPSTVGTPRILQGDPR